MVDAVLRVVLQNINFLLQQEFGLVWGVDREMRRLSDTLHTIRDVLEDAEMKQFKDKETKGWLKKLKDAAYDADDILDECAAKALQLEESQMSNCTNQVSNSFLSWFNLEKLMFRLKIGHRIKDIRERFDDIADARSKFHLNPRGNAVEWTFETSERETTSILTEPRVYGRDEDREEIVKILVDNINNPELLVYPIIGIGGLGKTTLAQLVYNDERVKNQFEARNWVCVSDDFDVKRLTKAIIETMGGTASDLTELESMQSRLREMLSRRRFLLVLDDVWNENQDKWDKLKFSLTCGIQGCSILVTTRLEKVASIMGTFPAHHLKALSKDDCWALFKQRAFGDGRDEIANLVVIGKEIVKKCGGVPLAAKALGSLMRFKNKETEWLVVRDSEIWDLPEDEENTILPALRLSYNHLPSHLRQCFAYCSIFPKDHRIQKEQLVHLWMANGFIPSKGKMELEDIGNEIFNELVWRSFFQDEEKDDYLNVVNCKMHDLVHDLACSIMGKECLTLKTSGEIIVPKGIRHLSLEPENILSADDIQMLVASTNESLRKFQTIRTLLLTASGYRPFSFSAAYLKFPNFNISNRRCIRALELRFSFVSPRPSSAAYLTDLRYLIHLRYLKLYMMSISTLPESLSNLKHLQTLILHYCPYLQKLPAQLSTMSSLRHLDICGCGSLRQMPIGIGKLIHIQTLSMFIVGKKSGYCINELKGLNLRGELQIRDLENVKNSVDAKEANLMEKRNLNWLTLSWSPHNDQTHIQENVDEVLEGLQPPISVKELEIERYQGMKFPSWMEDLSLQNLVRVRLSDCKRCEHLPPLGHLPLLKFLLVRGMDSVRYLLDVESDSGDGSAKGFPLLEELQLIGMLNLEELLLNVTRGREVVVFPCLVSMRIMDCDKLKTLPLLPSLKSLFLHTKESENIPEGLLQNRNLPVLESLTFDNSPNLVNLPRLSIRHGEYGFSSLKDFRVTQCDAMKYLWEDETQFQGLCSLKVLRIEYCDRLETLSGMRYITSLENLRIDKCPKLELSKLEDFRHLTSLQEIEIVNMCESISWPESLKHTTMLQRLHISCCTGLTALPEWIHNLPSLRIIDISSCQNLSFLPDGFQHMTALQTLIIDNCPVLETRYREGGEDWHKISHIPNVIFRS
ncbi:putative disease resistance protein RGA4 [Macadamia integrifolia]|uniref:putative disease resistance protein RGA4 n=1 Tax=Macadamia integrifolia TaxID=60698 RepID=UPI001C4F72E0|nr:putative disease resistance protein RGA4 [Macadamia integrifolia]XP_042485397.1 putative disease resistance protein RGA4 [Macadamia integrifolia]XP_042485398.1 putative disease resistance protein RGA4 [Macadamia integrifolia]XP_042485399.1 putative disease resistance protein RGA4 [Macadamia integrifolia]XP_042485400.1 putative disease resistance protein RGA4 [Macadamia integrifolia]XP_042485401.1 putative disease resistance protein RGA4 [Macadamia integrifolia]XP_042485402.1 putative disea